MLEKGVVVGLVACSNAIPAETEEQIKELGFMLSDMGLEVREAKYLFSDKISEGTIKQRAKELMKMFLNPEIKAVFDISGGNIANEILPYLDYNLIEENAKPFFGYSDLTSVLNAIYHKTGIHTGLFQIRNLIYEHGERQRADFEMTLLGGENHLYDIDYEFVRGDSLKGVVIGGNLRCLLKLAGTEYMPSFRHKILMLESLNGNEATIRSCFAQLEQMGAFNEVNGVLLGQFTKLQKKSKKKAANILMDVCQNDRFPIVVTEEIGHGADSKAMFIGMDIEFD